MIHNFKVSNFYSIGEKVLLDFESKKSTVKYPELYADTALNTITSKITFIGGKNSSGKTNLLRALSFLQRLLTSQAQPGAKFPYSKFISKTTLPTTMEATFSFQNDIIFTYKITLTTERILSEELSARRLVNKRTSETTLLSRKWNSKNSTYQIAISPSLDSIAQIKQADNIANVNQCSSMVALFMPYDNPDGAIAQVYNFWNQVFSNNLIFGLAEPEIPLTTMSAIMLENIYNNPELNEQVSKVLKKFDIGFEKIEKRENINSNQPTEIYGILHTYNSVGHSILMQNESSGTKRLINLLFFIMHTLMTGGVAIIDELDAFLHPDITDAILELFMSPTSNPKNAQIIFSSHNYSIMAQLEKQQIILTNRNSDGETYAWRLSDVKGIRPDDNYYTQYLVNRYGGKPAIEA